MHHPHLPYWLATLYLPAINLRQFHQLLKYFSNIRDLFEADKETLTARNISTLQQAALKEMPWKKIEADLRWGEQVGCHLIGYDDPLYPPLLKEITDPPLLLYCQGNETVLSSLQIAMVGARQATYQGLKTAEHFAAALSEVQFTITSGMALGIDGASHRGALKAKGRTIAVMGSGLKHLHPKTHHKLAREIVEEEGAIISEFPLNTPPMPCNFPKRNRVISGMSVGVLVVEAALKSGSLVTARLAGEQNREVFAIPGSIHQAQSKGCHLLIREGATLVESIADILEALPPHAKPQNLSKIVQNDGEAPSLSVEERQVFDTIQVELTPLDVIILRSALTPGKVSSILLSLELNGLIKAIPGGYVRELTERR